MKNNKGFTLIELICVVTLIAIIALIAVPAVANNIKESQESIYKNQITALEEALANYAIKIRNELPEQDGEFREVTLQELKDASLIEENFKNPKKAGKDKNFLEDDLELRIIKYHSNFIYSVQEK